MEILKSADGSVGWLGFNIRGRRFVFGFHDGFKFKPSRLKLASLTMYYVGPLVFGSFSKKDIGPVLEALTETKNGNV